MGETTKNNNTNDKNSNDNNNNNNGKKGEEEDNNHPDNKEETSAEEDGEMIQTILWIVGLKSKEKAQEITRHIIISKLTKFLETNYTKNGTPLHYYPRKKQRI